MLNFLRVFVLSFVMIVTATIANAATCGGSVSDINFGNVELRSGVTNNSTASLNISCTDPLQAAVGVCVRLGSGLAGAGPNNSPRYLSGPGGDNLSYQLRPNGFSGSNGVWNDQFFLIPMIAGTGSLSTSIYAQITSGTPSVLPGYYSSSFAASDAILDYDVTSCSDAGGSSTTLSSFLVSGTVVASCEVNSTNMNFGTLPSPVTQNVDAQASVIVQCTQGEDYSVSLSLGDGTGVSNPAMRKMTSVSDTISYGLYKDASRNLVWGNLSSNDVDSTGTGSAQLFSVFGRVHNGQSPSFGQYSDLIIITVEY